MVCLPVGSEFLATLLAMPLIGHRIAAVRIRAGYRTQGAFADALGVSRGLVGQWESHKKKPGRENLAGIARLCGISMEYLQGEVSEMGHSIVVSAEREIKLLLAFRQMSSLQQERLAEFVDEAVNSRRLVQSKREPA